MDCRVVVEAAVPVYDVETPDEAVRIAISKTGTMINPDLNYVEIEVGERTSPGGEALEPVFLVAGAALVALTFEMDVFAVDREKHASRIARTELGDRLVDIPLDVIEVTTLDDDTDGSAERNPATESENNTDEPTPRADDEADSDILPSFEQLLEE